MIWHQDVAADPGAMPGTSESEPNKRIVQMRIRENLPSLRDVGSNEINGMPDKDSLEACQAAFHV